MRGSHLCRFVADTAVCCGEGGIRSWDYVRMGFLCRMGVLNEWLTEEESLWLQSRIQLRALSYYLEAGLQYFSAYYAVCTGSYGMVINYRCYARHSPVGVYDDAGRRYDEWLIAGKDSFLRRCRVRYLPLS